MRGLYTAMFLLFGFAATAQNMDYQDLNLKRINTNQTGMTILGSWAAANLVSGTAGYFIADQTEWKAFHGMNAMWNVVNGVIAIGGYIGARKELNQEFTAESAYKRYKANKTMFLINVGLDALYIGTGVVLADQSIKFNEPQMWLGFGRSIALQGVALLMFDGIMFSIHQGQNKKWKKIISGLNVSGNSVGYIYRF